MHTVLSAFNDLPTAQRAMDKLAEAGFDRSDMHMQHRDMQHDGAMDRETWDGMEREVAMDSHVLDAIGNFFTRVFGREHADGHVNTYAQSVARGECVVVLDADDELQAQRAAALLDECGGRDRNIVPRSRQKPLRDIVAGRQAIH